MTARVLVVDDLPQNVKLLEAKLTAEYFNVLTASSGQEALKIVDIARPDIILLDVMMPDMDGFEVCRRIKADAKSSHIPVVMVTALDQTSDRVKGLEAGADDFLTKPVDDLALFARVRSLVRLKMAMDELRLREDTSEQLGAFGESLGKTGQLEISKARVFLVEDNERNVDRISSIFDEAGIEIIVAQDVDTVPARVIAEKADLLICSMELKNDDALRLASAIRSGEETRILPILLLMREGDTERLAKGFDIGVNDYLVRPIDRQELLARARTQIRRKRYQDQLRSNYRESVSLAVTDALTGLFNRRYFDVHVEGELRRAASAGQPLSLLMLDIDHFKVVNDTFGHGVGDEVLMEMARRIPRYVRTFDMVARLGGEEFVVIMPNTDEAAAAGVAERLRAAIAENPITISSPENTIGITASFGVAATSDGDEPAQHLLARADGAMYQAKQQGRNRVVVASYDEPAAAALS